MARNQTSGLSPATKLSHRLLERSNVTEIEIDVIATPGETHAAILLEGFRDTNSLLTATHLEKVGLIKILGGVAELRH